MTLSDIPVVVIQGSDAEEKVGSSGGYHKCRNDSGMFAVGASKGDSTVHQEVSEVNDTVVCTSRNSGQHVYFNEYNLKTGKFISKCIRNSHLRWEIWEFILCAISLKLLPGGHLMHLTFTTVLPPI